MRKSLLGTTALVGAAALAGGAVAIAAEAPEWKLSGNMNFQFYWVDQDNSAAGQATWAAAGAIGPDTDIYFNDPPIWFTGATGIQDHDWYFGVDEAELALNVSGAADNGLKYGFKIEIQVNTDDGPKGIADEARIQLSGSWGTLQLGDEDGAEDTMNYGGENLMGATGGFDGDQDDYLVRDGDYDTLIWDFDDGAPSFYALNGNAAAPGGPSIAGDTSDKTKVTYYSPRFSGFQVGASITPTPNGGDDFKKDGDWENHYGIGANYDNTFGSLRIRASAVYSAASSNETEYEDIAAWSVGGIVGFGPFSVGANYTDNGESGELVNFIGGGSLGIESSYWNVAAGFETGALSLSAGYFSSVKEIPVFGDSTYEHIALTADYTVAPGLGVYAEVNLISDEMLPLLGRLEPDAPPLLTNDTTSFVMGVNVSF